MQGFLEFSEEKKIVVKTKMGGEIPATIKVTGKDYHIVKTASGKQYKVDHQGNSLEESVEDDLLSKSVKEETSLEEKVEPISSRRTIRQKGQFPAPREQRPNGGLSKSEKIGPDGKIYHWQDPRGDVKEETDLNESRGFTKPRGHTEIDASEYNEILKTRENSGQKNHRQSDIKTDSVTGKVSHTRITHDGGQAFHGIPGVERHHDHATGKSKYYKQNLVKKEELEIDEAFDKGQVTIHSPGHRLHGKTGDVFYRHDDGRVNVQIRHSNRKGDVTNLTLGKDQYKEVTKEAVDDKDLPFTPDKKKTKPSTPGKYGDAYSTVRNLARKALEKQKQAMKEETLEEGTHRVAVWTTEPNHEKAQKRDYQTQKMMRVTASSNSEAEKKAREHYEKQGNYKVHKVVHHGLVKEEEQLDEKSAQARANKARKNVMDAGRGAAYRQKTGVNLDPKTDGYPSQQAMNKALGRFLRREELDLQEAAPVAPSVGVHRIGVTVSDPGHTAVSKRNEKLQKFVRVTANSKENAVEQGKKHFAKKGWKVHDAEHVGMVHEEVDLEESKKGYAPGWMLKADPELAKKVKANTQGYKDLKKYAGKDIPKKEVAEGYRGNSEADKPYWEAEKHKKEAEKARKSGDNFSYHKFMSAHHDALSHWNANKGRHHVADQHAMKADNHEDWAQEARKEKK